MNIIIIGKASPIQRHLKNNVEDILHELKLTCQIDIIHTMDEILKIEEKQILLTPALIVDDKILCQGYIWSKEQIRDFVIKLCPKTENKTNNTSSDKYAKWKGIPRENITWHPMIDTDKCTGCGMCVTSCGRDVFDFDVNQNIAVVARPLQCMVGCTSCKVWCYYDAIEFPDTRIVKNFIKRNKILLTAKKDLENRIKKTKILKERGRMKKIKILGGGCPKCHKLAQHAEEAAKELNLEYQIEKISDWKEYQKYGVMMTPALVIDEQLKSSGRVSSVEDIKKYLKE